MWTLNEKCIPKRLRDGMFHAFLLPAQPFCWTLNDGLRVLLVGVTFSGWADLPRREYFFASRIASSTHMFPTLSFAIENINNVISFEAVFQKGLCRSRRWWIYHSHTLQSTARQAWYLRSMVQYCQHRSQSHFVLLLRIKWVEALPISSRRLLSIEWTIRLVEVQQTYHKRFVGAIDCSFWFDFSRQARMSTPIKWWRFLRLSQIMWIFQSNPSLSKFFIRFASKLFPVGSTSFEDRFHWRLSR